ncbi:unnamed protein product [Aspergillus oryzae]|nr:unnamed protein product [Aspergillus oryzae]GMF84603.1 unnamed protein product [Aspergillus oryzae]
MFHGIGNSTNSGVSGAKNRGLGVEGGSPMVVANTSSLRLCDTIWRLNQTSLLKWVTSSFQAIQTKLEIRTQKQLKQVPIEQRVELNRNRNKSQPRRKSRRLQATRIFELKGHPSSGANPSPWLNNLGGFASKEKSKRASQIESEQDEDTIHQGDAFSFEVVHGRGYQVSRWKIEGSTTVTMDEIRFHLDMFPGRHYERDLVITKADLLKFARRF